MLQRVLALTCALALIALAADASATAQRTFVASTGNDANPCSIGQPCRAFARAIIQTSSGGEVIVLDSAGYGPVTITKSVSLIAPAGIYAGITVSSGDGVTVNVPGGTVVLRGLSINGQGGSNGVNVLHAARVRIESCVISKMAVDGVTHSAPGAELIVLDTIVRDNGASGIGGDADASVVLDHVRSEHNGTNGFYMASLIGKARAMISDSIFAFNGGNGVWVAATNTGETDAHVERSVLALNGGLGLNISATAASAVQAVVSRNAVYINAGFGVGVSGPGSAFATVTENAFDSSLSADGAQTFVEASANTGTSFFSQSNGATLSTYGNNAGVQGSAGVIVPMGLF